MEYRLQDLMDIEQFQSLQDRLNVIYPFPSAIIDNEGEILTATAWQDICTKFHRQNRECERECIKSDLYILDHLAEADPAVSYRCPHGLIDNAMPIIVDGQHLGNFFTGQFFMEAPDLEFFREQAGKYGFDEDAYIQAVERVPVWGQEQLNSYLFFIKELIQVICSVGLRTLREIEAARESQQSERRFRSLFEQAGDYILVLEVTEDRDLIVVDANQAACHIHGYSREEFLGTSIRDLDRALSEEQVGALLDRIVSGESVLFETEHVKKDGTVFPVEVSAALLDIGEGPPLITSVERDITERKRTEVERERLMAAIEQTGETVVITDTEGAIQYANPAFERITGYTREEAVGQNPRILKSGQHDDAFYKEMWDILGRGEVWAGRLVNKKKDDTLFTEEATISPVRDSSGKTVNYVAVKRDITHEIGLAAQLRQAQKMEAVGQLAGGIAHDFNNILQAILGYGEMALDCAGATSSVGAAVKEMMKAGDRAATLIGQLLAFSRQQVLDIKDVCLNDVIADLMKMLRRVIGEHITLNAISGHDLGVVRADPGQIGQILMNLCVNARDAMGEGGRITIETENVRIDEAYCMTHTWAEPGRYALLSVTDTGCGMDEETLGKVFEPFFTTKDVGKGTGLGLATVYGLVKQHKGMIHVYSEVGKGTTFKIYLPQTERLATAVGDKIEGPVPGGTETILLAEDDEMVRELTKAFLEHGGYTVLAAVDGEEALRIFEEHADEIDMALLDAMMPNLSGRAVCERIRETRPDLRFLFASGYSMNALHTNFVLDEGLTLIQKPCSRDDLLRRVREVLDGGE